MAYLNHLNSLPNQLSDLPRLSTVGYPILTENGRVIIVPPWFRFRPTDEEIVVQYLRKKVLGRPLPAGVIHEIDLGRHEPWDLPGLQNGEVYFFSIRGRGKIAAAGSGYWKAARGEKRVMVAGQLVGTKKALHFYRRGSRTDWIMHEYRLAIAVADYAEAQNTFRRMSSQSMKNTSVDIKEWVACKVFKKERVTRAGAESPTSSSASCVTDNSDGCSDGEGDSIRNFA